jgi:hypothetical protein
MPLRWIAFFLAEIQTDLGELDAEISVTACRNVCAELCAVSTTRP